jgi:hypothetical protein
VCVENRGTSAANATRRTTFDQLHKLNGSPWLRRDSDKNSGPLGTADPGPVREIARQQHPGRGPTESESLTDYVAYHRLQFATSTVRTAREAGSASPRRGGLGCDRRPGVVFLEPRARPVRICPT